MFEINIILDETTQTGLTVTATLFFDGVLENVVTLAELPANSAVYTNSVSLPSGLPNGDHLVRFDAAGVGKVGEGVLTLPIPSPSSSSSGTSGAIRIPYSGIRRRLRLSIGCATTAVLYLVSPRTEQTDSLTSVSEAVLSVIERESDTVPIFQKSISGGSITNDGSRLTISFASADTVSMTPGDYLGQLTVSIAGNQYRADLILVEVRP